MLLHPSSTSRDPVRGHPAAYLPGRVRDIASGRLSVADHARIGRLQFRSVRVFTSSATSQIQASRSQKCLEPCTQSDSNKSSVDRLCTVISLRRIVFKRPQRSSACSDEANKLEATSQCNSTSKRPSSRLNERLCCVRMRSACWASVQGVPQMNPCAVSRSLARSNVGLAHENVQVNKSAQLQFSIRVNREGRTLVGNGLDSLGGKRLGGCGTVLQSTKYCARDFPGSLL